MPQNLELKARYSHTPASRDFLVNLGARFSGVLHQRDTYYDFVRGRLKLREIKGSGAELIWYQRPNTRRNRYSNYTVVPVRHVSELKKTLKALLKVKVVVQKKRRLYIWKNARIHLDTVVKLGGFIEFEVLVIRGKVQAQRILERLQKALCVKGSSVVVSSYSDLMLHQSRGRR